MTRGIYTHCSHIKLVAVHISRNVKKKKKKKKKRKKEQVFVYFCTTKRLLTLVKLKVIQYIVFSGSNTPLSVY